VIFNGILVKITLFTCANKDEHGNVNDHNNKINIYYSYNIDKSPLPLTDPRDAVLQIHRVV